jgi:hypothetical protein
MARRSVERQAFAAEHTGLRQDLDRVGGSLDEELGPNAPVEPAPRVRPDLGLDAERAKDREGPPSDRRFREVEVERQLAAPVQVHRARRVEESRQLGKAVAAPHRNDRRELGACVAR